MPRILESADTEVWKWNVEISGAAGQFRATQFTLKALNFLVAEIVANPEKKTVLVLTRDGEALLFDTALGDDISGPQLKRRYEQPYAELVMSTAREMERGGSKIEHLCYANADKLLAYFADRIVVSSDNSSFAIHLKNGEILEISNIAQARDSSQIDLPQPGLLKRILSES